MGFFFSYMVMGLRLAVFRAAGAPLLRHQRVCDFNYDLAGLLGQEKNSLNLETVVTFLISASDISGVTLHLS